MRLSSLVFIVVMCVSSTVSADPMNGHDVPFSLDDVKTARYLCGISSDREVTDYCSVIPTMTDQEVLSRLESFRENCLDWLDVKPRVNRLIEAHDPHIFGIDHHQIDVICALPPVLRVNAYARVRSDPGYIAASLSRLENRVGNAERAESLSEELLIELQSAYASLRLQSADGQLRPSTMGSLRQHLDACTDIVEVGPRSMFDGLEYEPWAATAKECVESSTDAVYQSARDGEPDDLGWMWITAIVALVVSLVSLGLWNGRHRRALGQIAISEWQTQIDDARKRLEESARNADTDHERAEHNVMLARIAALDDWLEAFGDDATEPDVIRSAEIAHINKKDYVWRGFRAAQPPRATVTGNAKQFLARVQRFLGTENSS